MIAKSIRGSDCFARRAESSIPKNGVRKFRPKLQQDDEAASAPDRFEKKTLSELSIYRKQIAGFPLLADEEVAQLARRIETGDASARGKLIEGNLRLVIRIAQRYTLPPGHSLLDLI